MNNANVQTRQQRRYQKRKERKGIAKPQKNAFRRAYEAFKLRAEALKAASILTPLLAKLALMDLAMRLGDYKSRGHGKNAPSYALGRGSRGGSWPKAHQSGQECLRRALGGWAFRQRFTGMTKVETLRFLAPKQRMRLETAIATVRGLSMREAA